jgi:hypothetical protein
MTDDAPSIEQASGDDVLTQLKGIKTAVARLPVAPTEVFDFELDPANNQSTLRQSTHVKINIQYLMITASATPAVITFNIGGRSFPFQLDGSVPIPLPLPIKWDRGVDAWFASSVAQTGLHCYVIGTAE